MDDVKGSLPPKNSKENGVIRVDIGTFNKMARYKEMYGVSKTHMAIVAINNWLDSRLSDEE